MTIKKDTMIARLAEQLQKPDFSTSKIFEDSIDLYIYYQRSWGDIINKKLEYQTRLSEPGGEPVKVILLIGTSGTGKSSLATFNINKENVYSFTLSPTNAAFFNNYDYTKHRRLVINEWSYLAAKPMMETLNNLFDTHQDFVGNVKYGSQKILCKQYVICTQEDLINTLGKAKFIQSIIRRCTSILIVEKFQNFETINVDLDLGYNVKGIQPNYVWDITKSAQYFEIGRAHV